MKRKRLGPYRVKGITRLDARQAPRQTTAVDPDVALYRFEKSKHSPARFESSLRHPIINMRKLLVDARVRNLDFDDREVW